MMVVPFHCKLVWAHWAYLRLRDHFFVRYCIDRTLRHPELTFGALHRRLSSNYRVRKRQFRLSLRLQRLLYLQLGTRVVWHKQQLQLPPSDQSTVPGSPLHTHTRSRHPPAPAGQPACTSRLSDRNPASSSGGGRSRPGTTVRGSGRRWGCLWWCARCQRGCSWRSRPWPRWCWSQRQGGQCDRRG